jgi:hypothetical protein
VTDPDPVELAMREIQRTSTEPGTPNPLSPDPAGNLVREVILGPENSIAKAPAEPDPNLIAPPVPAEAVETRSPLQKTILEPEEESSEPERREPIDLEAMPTLGSSLVWSDGEVVRPANPDDPVATTALIQTTIEDRLETLQPKHVDVPSELTVNKITWPLIGRVIDPGRYMFRFGWLTVTAADLAIWKAYPNAAFTLIRTSTPPPVGAEEELAGEESRLGTFELRIDSNYSESER